MAKKILLPIFPLNGAILFLETKMIDFALGKKKILEMM